MKREFCTYEQALALKELGFNEPCFGTYGYNGEEKSTYFPLEYICKKEEYELEPFDIRNSNIGDDVSAPLKQQVFRWLLIKHNLYGIIIPTVTMHWTFKTMTVVEGMVEAPPYNHVDANDYSTYEEAESACIDKLIEIVKNK